MALDREDTLKKAEKLLRQGRLDAAIVEYARVVEDQPRDWNTANTLGDLYGRAGQIDKAIGQYTRIAEHLMREGFYPKAAALYKKILKVKSDDESSQLQLAEISAIQGLIADAKTHFGAVAARRRGRGDDAGADEIVVRLGSLDPADLDARLAAARVVAGTDQTDGARRFRELHADFMDRGRRDDALEALREAVRLNPDDKEGRVELARAAVADGDIETARQYLDRATAGNDPDLLLALANVELRGGQLDEGRGLLTEILASNASIRPRVIDLGWALSDVSADAAFVCLDLAVDAASAEKDYLEGAGLLQELGTRHHGYIPALLKLVEVCVDGGLESTMYEAQAQLADAYLEAGQASEARVIAEDLVAREPWERAHIERFRRALVMLKVPDPDTHIAERLSGQAPFMATDPFVDLSDLDSPPPASALEPSLEVLEHEDVSEDEEPLESSAAAHASGRDGVEIDLTGLLGDLEEGSAQAGEGGTTGDFQDFHDEVSRQTDAEEAAQQLKLARTYLDMGMTDEAIVALATAARAPRQRFEASAMLARLFRQRSDVAHAIEWFERAAEAPAPTADDGRALLYDLGTMLEGAGETSRALAVYLELQSDAADYRDVTTRIGRLSSGG